MENRYFFSNSFFFFEQLESILATEESRLSYQPDQEERMAGIEAFNIFEEFSTIYSLSKTLNKSFDEVCNMVYSEAFVVLLYEAETAKYQKRLSKNINK